MKKFFYLSLFVAISTSLFAQLPCTSEAEWKNIGGGVAALVLQYSNGAEADMIQTHAGQAVQITNLDINGEVIRDLGGANVPISISLNPPTGGLQGSGENMYRLIGPQIRLLEPALPVADRGVFTGTITISNDNGATSTTCTYVDGALVTSPPPTTPELSVSSLDGLLSPPCFAGTGLTFTQGQTINVQGEVNVPAGTSINYIAVRYHKLTPGFATIYVDGGSYAGSSPFNINHTIPADAPPSDGVNFSTIQVFAELNTGGTISYISCLYFITLNAGITSSVAITSVEGAPVLACDTGPVVALVQGQEFTVEGNITAPAGGTATSLAVKHLVFSPGFASLEHVTEVSYPNPPENFSYTHTIDPTAPVTAEYPIQIVQVVASYSDGTSKFCNAFITLVPPSVPTMGQWAMIIFALIMATLYMLLIATPKLATPNGQTISTGINFKQLPFDKTNFFKYWALVAAAVVAIFAVAIAFFGYEMTSSDPYGSMIASGIAAYMLTLVRNYK